MLSFRLKKQTSKTVVDTTFKPQYTRKIDRAKPDKRKTQRSHYLRIRLESEDEIIQKSNNSNNNSTIENYQEETIQKNINTILENGLKEINNLSAPLEKLSVSHQEPELSKLPTLMRNTKV